MTSETERPVLIAGAGPAGLLLALLLAKRSIPVYVIEMENTVDSRPRATHYGAPAVHELERAGVLQDIRKEGFIPRSVTWRKPDGALLVELDRTCLDENDSIHCLPLNRLSQILCHHLAQNASARILWNHKVVDIGQDGSKVWADVEHMEAVTRLEGSFLVGCDGAKSQVRRSLFGKNALFGKTWDQQLVATNVYYPFDKYGYSDVNFIIDPENWHMAAKISKDGLWRVTYGEKQDLSEEVVLARQPAKFEQLLPSHPKPEDQDAYMLMSISPYRVHQRQVEKMHVGRICLAADAAHLCNPFGGLGLTGGLLDAGALYDCISGIIDGLANKNILDKYDEIRGQVFRSIVDPVSSSNFLLLQRDSDDSSLMQDSFIELAKRAALDADFSREFQTRSLEMRVDFTKFYHQSGFVDRY
ncbi:hypothetical protein yc1106_10143 [Curvularia clavata]|uniref:FAD-binding domain-containing protein n=1 Tax=Curvularia clavata TaxID=95742 RepID=A0A9Q9DYD6_CURCL|nr:hypothetical protein yc1106_10143 [Curvularia clavata]